MFHNLIQWFQSIQALHLKKVGCIHAKTWWFTKPRKKDKVAYLVICTNKARSSVVFPFNDIESVCVCVGWGGGGGGGGVGWGVKRLIMFHNDHQRILNHQL